MMFATQMMFAAQMMYAMQMMFATQMMFACGKWTTPPSPAVTPPLTRGGFGGAEGAFGAEK